MRHVSLLSFPILLTLTASLVALPAHASGVSLRRGGTASGAETRSFAFDNAFGLGLMNAAFVFQSGEHDVARIGHMVGVGAAHNWLSSDTAATYDYDFKHYPLSGHVYTAHELECDGVCGLGIDPPPADHVLVLAGFVFEATDGDARSVSTIAIEPDTDNNVIWVEFNDGTNFTYGATVQYAYIPVQDVVGGAVRSASKTSNNHLRVQFKWDDLAGSVSPLLWHGFRVHFADDTPRPLNRLQLLASGNKATVYFADAGYDDSFEGSIAIVPTIY